MLHFRGSGSNRYQSSRILGLEVWQNPKDIFLGQGKYALEILNKFKTLDCKAISTSMALNLKLLCDPTSEIVDAIVYKNMISSLMYLMNMRSDI